MFIGKPSGNTDRILDFSTAVTGALFYVPTIDFLDDPPTLAPAAAAPTAEGGAASGDSEHNDAVVLAELLRGGR